MVWSTNTDVIINKKVGNSTTSNGKKRSINKFSIHLPPTWNANTVYKFIQILWEKGLDWDDKLDDKDKETWTKMTQDIHKLSSIQIPRFIGNGKSQLLCFCDSLNKAYAAAIYLRVVRDGKVSMKILF